MQKPSKSFYDLYDMWSDALEKRKTKFLNEHNWPSMFDYQLTLSKTIGMIVRFLSDLKKDDYHIYSAKLFELIKERITLIEDYREAFLDRELYQLYSQDAIVNVEKDFLYNDLLKLEEKFDIPVKDFCSVKIFNYLMKCKKERSEYVFPFSLTGVNIVDDYLFFAADVDLIFHDKRSEELFNLIDKQFNEAIDTYNQNTSYLSLYLGLDKIDKLKTIYRKKQELYKKYHKDSSSIDEAILDINNRIHQFAQEEIRDSYEIEINKKYKNGEDDEAIKLSKAIIMIDEERFLINNEAPEYKLMLIKHLDKLITSVDLSDEDEKKYRNRLNELKKTLTYDDEYVLDGDKEYKRNPQ